MPLNLNGVDAKASGFEPIPDGVYPLRIFKGEEKPAVDGKNGAHNFQLKVQFGEHEGRLVFANFATTEKMAPYIKHFYQVIGETDFSELDPTKYDGKPLRGEVVTEEYNGKKTNKLRIGAYYPWDGSEDTAYGVDSEKAAPAKTASTATTKVEAKPAVKSGSPFSNSKKAPPSAAKAAGTAGAPEDEPPF